MYIRSCTHTYTNAPTASVQPSPPSWPNLGTRSSPAHFPLLLHALHAQRSASCRRPSRVESRMPLFSLGPHVSRTREGTRSICPRTPHESEAALHVRLFPCGTRLSAAGEKANQRCRFLSSHCFRHSSSSVRPAPSLVLRPSQATPSAPWMPPRARHRAPASSCVVGTHRDQRRRAP